MNGKMVYTNSYGGWMGLDFYFQKINRGNNP